MAANATPPTACNSIVVTSSSNLLPLGKPSMLGMNCKFALALKRGSVNPKTAACTIPSGLKSALVLAVTGTAIFNLK